MHKLTLIINNQTMRTIM